MTGRPQVAPTVLYDKQLDKSEFTRGELQGGVEKAVQDRCDPEQLCAWLFQFVEATGEGREAVLQEPIQFREVHFL